MKQLDKAIDILQQGGIIIFPTDTAFGIGCRVDNERSVKRLFQIKKRSIKQATPILVDSVEMASFYLFSPLSKNVRRLMADFWPGALTIVYDCQIGKVPSLVRGGDKTIGVRKPDHKVALKLISAVGVPILGSSANFHGLPTPFTISQLDHRLIQLVDYVVEGTCKLVNVSTVIDCSVIPWQLIRQGAVNVNINRYHAGEVGLYINTTDNRKIKVELIFDEHKVTIEKSVDNFSSQLLLPTIIELLKRQNIKLEDLTQVQVHTGPGSYTGIRVGIAVAQALAWMLQIPLNGAKKYSIDPQYNI